MLKMKIKIDEKYWLMTDPWNWAIKKYKGIDKDGNETYSTLGYYTSPGKAMKGLASHIIMTSEINNFLEAYKKIDELENKFNKLLEVNMGDK